MQVKNEMCRIININIEVIQHVASNEPQINAKQFFCLFV